MQKRRITLLVLLCMIIVGEYSNVKANAAEPPQLVIIVTNIEDDVDLFLHVPGREEERVSRRRRAWETHFSIYRGMTAGPEEMKNAQLLFKRENQVLAHFDFPDTQIKSYNTLWHYDFAKQELTLSEPPSRQILLVGSRVIITLLIEGLVFFIFGYREKKSWIAFLLVNLISQGLLNYSLIGASTGYVFLGLIFMEILIFIFEGAILTSVITEKKRRRTLLFVITANLLSFIFGGWAIANLPL